MAEKITKSEEAWQKILSPEQYRVSRKGGTEGAFTGEYHDFKEEGIYTCICCANPLFDSKTKYDSRTGWPSFYQTLAPESVIIRTDTSLGMERKEVLCSLCDAHLGHVFSDGPPPSGLRYCMNSVALNFEQASKYAH